MKELLSLLGSKLLTLAHKKNWFSLSTLLLIGYLFISLANKNDQLINKTDQLVNLMVKNHQQEQAFNKEKHNWQLQLIGINQERLIDSLQAIHKEEMRDLTYRHSVETASWNPREQDLSTLDSLINFMLVDAVDIDLNNRIKHSYLAYENDDIRLLTKLKMSAWIKASMLVSKLNKTEQYQYLMDQIYKPRNYNRVSGNNITTASVQN
ncbi:MAG: hypothetical protein ABJQ37_19975 [Reichenbachiella sp.]|uniref:hypothetical protein n=1 Tax=Reichenbachiella sp. TaxID=2184521 RepID=UPI00329879F6